MKRDNNLIKARRLVMKQKASVYAKAGLRLEVILKVLSCDHHLAIKTITEELSKD